MSDYMVIPNKQSLRKISVEKEHSMVSREAMKKRIISYRDALKQK